MFYVHLFKSVHKNFLSKKKGYLYQVIGEEKQLVSLVSKSLTSTQLAWSVIQKEAYAIFSVVLISIIYYEIENLQYLRTIRT